MKKQKTKKKIKKMTMIKVIQIYGFGNKRTTNKKMTMIKVIQIYGIGILNLI